MEQTVNLQPHQQRVVEEYKELKDKTTKLGAFILYNPIYLSLSLKWLNMNNINTTSIARLSQNPQLLIGSLEIE
jgi:hypothetical protein